MQTPTKRRSTKSRRDPADEMEAAPPVASFRLPLGDSFGRTELGRKLSKKLSNLGAALGLEVPESSQSFRMQDSAAELVLDGRNTPAPPTWDRVSQLSSTSRGASGFLTRAISSMLPIDHKKVAKALEEDEDEDDARASMVFDDRPLEGLPPAGEPVDVESLEWWFHLDEKDNIHGPFSPSEMRRQYMGGRLGHATMVRWLPVSYSKPVAAEQPVDGFSPLQELCSDQGPPFMDAPPDAAPAASTTTASAATVRSRVDRARRSLAHVKPVTGTERQGSVESGTGSGRDELSMRI